MYLNTFCNRKAAVRLLLCLNVTKTAGKSGQTTNRFNTQLLRVMRLTAIILFAGCLQVAAKVNSQTITYSAKNAELQSLFTVIKKQTGFSVIVKKDFLKETTPINIEAANMPLEEFLSAIFKDQPLVFVIEAGTIFLNKKITTPTITENLTQAQPPVTGTVKDSTGIPLVGATVTVKSTKKSVQTNAKGEFTIEAEANDVLTITFVGFEKQIVRLTGNHSVFVVLHAANSPLDEVQIRAYGKTSRRLNIGTITTIKGEDIAKQPITNPLLAMQGRVPNLVITPTNGLPNGPVTLQLRGQNSLAMTEGGQRIMTQPLIIIDGVPYQNNVSAGGGDGSFGIVGGQISALSFVNPNEIEQIDVLTDADATSIYGSRGGNGVILITTKKGKAGNTSTSFSVSTGFNEVPKKLDLLNTQQYLQVRKEAYINDGLPVPNKLSPDKNFNNFDLTVWDTSRYTDWQEEFLGGVAPFTNANASITGGTSAIQFLISGNYNRLKLIYPGENKYETGGANFNITTRSNNGKLETSFGGAYTINNSLSPSNLFARLAVVLAPNAPSIYDEEGNLNWERVDGLTTYSGTWQNPFAQLAIRTKSKTNTVRGNFAFTYHILPNLFFKTFAGYTDVNSKNLSLTPLAAFDPSIPDKTALSVHNFVNSTSLTVDPQIGYNVSLGKGRLDALAVASFQNQGESSETATGQGYSSDVLLESLNSASLITGTSTSSEYKYVALSGRLAYNWEDKYLINLTGRRDGSSRFGPGYQFGKFWSVGAGWIFTEEQFFKNIMPMLNFGKLRFSYGTSGNDGIGDYKYIELFTANNNVPYQGATVLVTDGSVNPDYHWENIKKLEAALELSALDGRVLFSVAYWRTRASDQLGFYPLPSTAGNDRLTRNQNAKIQNSGWDFALNTKNIKSKYLQWNTSLIFGVQKNKLLAKPEDLFNGYGLNRFAEVGKPFSGFVPVYEYKGVNTATGLYQFTDRSGNISSSGQNNFVDARKINLVPLTLGVSNSISFKGLTLDFFLQLTRQIGRNYLFDDAFVSYSNFYYGNFSSQLFNEYGNLPVEALSRWQTPGNISPVQKFSSKRFDFPFHDLYLKAKVSDFAWTDASFIKLRNVALSYDLPIGVKSKLNIQNLRIFVQGQNLLTITDYKGLDPETQSVTVLPQLRTIVGGVQLGF